MGIGALHVARTGLDAQNFRMQVIANNLANVNTPGYSRQRVELEARPGYGASQSAIGNGRTALDGAVAIYIDNLATGTRYTDAVIQAQFQRIKEELDRKPVLGKSMVTRATLFVRHVGNYRKQQRADPATILKELLASTGQKS